MKKKTFKVRRMGYALLLILISVCTGCSTTKLSDQKYHSLISGDLTILADQSKVAEILALLSNYSLNPQVMKEAKLFKNGESLLMMTINIQYRDSLELTQILHRLGGNYWGMKELDFQN
ncbi:hypothetical protein BDD43_0455 [Mucilaginibacter gracilis]|uniref:DUF4296 domain-containing protein n=1 Tax=Mucilaginibacter gracilis TaxID=423350 RepID=A0A495IUC5_9SPHI|nr:hypothetical protein [Mucilaginibacter gracilis]RKR80357.1 hypothetical protein BDD43_0455 [Mucilaginibacter gracilis]